MKDGIRPDPNTIHPIAGYENEIYIKPTLTNPNIIVGEFSYIAGTETSSSSAGSARSGTASNSS